LKKILGYSGYNYNMSTLRSHTGDDGSTGLLGKGRLPKYHPRIETLGALDEASAALGLARSLCKAPQTAGILIEVQRDLYSGMTEIAASPDAAGHFESLDQSRVVWLESQVEMISISAPPPQEFILPGDSVSGAALSLARTMVRRSERRVVELFDRGEIKNMVIMRYLNRLSTLCFALEILENGFAGKDTTKAKTIK
jgi:cob(I)alamin adenosyltransferase